MTKRKTNGMPLGPTFMDKITRDCAGNAKSRYNENTNIEKI